MSPVDRRKLSADTSSYRLHRTTGFLSLTVFRPFRKETAPFLRMNGSFSAPVMADGSFVMEAEAPLRLCASYPVEFRSLTSGEGQISMRLLDYREAPPDLDERFPRRGVDPLDRAKWILACRSALGADLTGRQ